MKTEKVLIIAFIIGIILKYLHIPGNGFILIISLMSIALLYFPGGFYFFSDKNIKNQNLALSIISGFFLAMIPMGILFKLHYWPGALILLSTGLAAALMILGIIFFLKLKALDNLKNYYKNMMIRTLVLAILAISLYLTSETTLLKIFHEVLPN